MNLKILFISPQNIIPPTDGGKQSIYYPLKYLAKQKNIEVYSIIIAHKDEKVIREEYIKLGLEDLEIIYLDKSDKSSKLIRNVFKKLPFKWSKYVSKESKSIALNFARKIKPNIVICSAPHTLVYGLEIKKILNIPIILREHNIEYKLVEQFYRLTNNPLYKIIGLWQFYKTYNQEKRYWDLADKVLFISDSDYQIAYKECQNLSYKFHILYDGFEIIKKSETLIYDKREANSLIISAPIKSSLQNLYNLKWFIDKIWKKFVSLNKDYKLYLTGSTEKDLEKILKLSKQDLKKLNIINLGFVENINKVIVTKKYFISPTIFGSGIRLKVLHALSLGMPVFLTETDYRTVNDFMDMENVILFRTPDEFAKKLKQLEEDKDLYKKISLNAKKLILDNLNWQNYVSKLIDIITNIGKEVNI